MGNLIDITNSFFGRRDIEWYSPIDVLYFVNPELGSLAYANKSKILTPELIPLITNFRELQHIEKKELMKNILCKLAIESEEKKVIAALENESQIISSIQDNVTTRQRIITSGQNYRSDNQVKMVDIQAKNALEFQKLKYSTDARIVNDYIDGEKYISDNEYNARRIEAIARRDALIFEDRMRTSQIKRISKDQLEDKLAYYNSEIKRAEIARDKEIQLKYIENETMLQSLNFQTEIERARILGELTTKTYDVLTQVIIEGTKVLAKSSYTTLEGQGLSESAGNFKYRIRFSND